MEGLGSDNEGQAGDIGQQTFLSRGRKCEGDPDESGSAKVGKNEIWGARRRALSPVWTGLPQLQSKGINSALGFQAMKYSKLHIYE